MVYVKCNYKKGQETSNLEREYRDCIKKQKRQDWDHKAYIVQLPNEEGDMHII